ncbi:rCG27352, partial [Rattus norvegicus]
MNVRREDEPPVCRLGPRLRDQQEDMFWKQAMYSYIGIGHELGYIKELLRILLGMATV